MADQHCPNTQHDPEEGEQSVDEVGRKGLLNVNGPYLSKKDTHQKATSVECVISNQESDDAIKGFALWVTMLGSRQEEHTHKKTDV